MERLCKVCTRCNNVKSIDSFYKGTASFGKMSWCKQCSNEYKKKYNAEHYVERRQTLDKWRYESIIGRSQSLMNAARRRASVKNLEFSLTKERIYFALRMGLCEVTKIPFQMERDVTIKTSRHPFSPSIDRKDPFRGYTDDNIQIVVSIYNLGKSQFSDEQFLNFCKLVAANVK